jgi:dipeptidyl aminopeptidase/acylaminoacyl peptidase
VDQFGEHRPPLGLALDDYRRNSSLSHADRVTTPLLMLHGEDDERGTPAQAEQFFYALYAQGKTARLVTFGGESHSLARSPATVRNAFAEIVAWFDRYVRVG